MLEFDPLNPFPLVKLSPELYPAAKRHAAKADEWLGLSVDATEARIHDPKDDQERWLGRHPSIFLTPYVELRAWLEELAPMSGDRVADLGAGYGRLGFVLARHFPQCRFLGFELVKERVESGRLALGKFGAPLAELRQADLSSPAFTPPPAEIYFIYDYGTKSAIGKTLSDLRELSTTIKFRVVGRGRAVRDQIEREHPWLSSVYPAVHHGHYSIYRNFDS
jgi:hypothetical protein